MKTIFNKIRKLLTKNKLVFIPLGEIDLQILPFGGVQEINSYKANHIPFDHNSLNSNI